MSALIYTAGCSNLPLARFVESLYARELKTVLEVRSNPHSSYTPWFNEFSLKAELERWGGIKHVRMGNELGGRPRDASLYNSETGRVQYELVSQSEPFKRGAAKAANLARSAKAAILCAEKDPADCHRALLVAPALADAEFEVRHILADGEEETHAEFLDRIVLAHGLPLGGDMFWTPEDVRREALRRQSRRVAYVLPKTQAHYRRRSEEEPDVTPCGLPTWEASPRAPRESALADEMIGTR